MTQETSIVYYDTKRRSESEIIEDGFYVEKNPVHDELDITVQDFGSVTIVPNSTVELTNTDTDNGHQKQGIYYRLPASDIIDYACSYS